jgi:putative transposase
MNAQGLQAVQKRCFRPQTTQSRHDEPIAPNRLKDLIEAPQRPNQVWAADIIYLPSQEEGWLYLAAEMDLCSKRIAGWKLDDSLAVGSSPASFRSRCSIRGPRLPPDA